MLFLGLNNIGLTKENKFNGLFATTTMVASKLLSNAIDESILIKNIKLILNKFDKIIIPPENQNSSTIWKYQSQWVMGIFNEFSTTEQQKVEAALPKLIKASRKVMEK